MKLLAVYAKVVLGLGVLCWALAAHAQPYGSYRLPNGGEVMPQVILCPPATGQSVVACHIGSYVGATPMTSGTPIAAGTGFAYQMTTAGSVTITFADASTITIPLPVASTFTILPWAVTEVLDVGSAAGTFISLH